MKTREQLEIELEAANTTIRLREVATTSRIESLRKIIHTAKLQMAAGDISDADLTLMLALRELG